MIINRLFQSLVLSIIVLFFPVAASAIEMATPAPPQLASKSYVLMDAKTGKVLVENNGDQRLPPASLTKLMTAYIATLEMKRGQLKPDELVTISEHAWRTQGSRMFVKLHSKVTVDNLLHGVIIQSGNDASVALAEHMAGSEDAFVDLMNKTAQELDLENTHFMNATGLPHENHYSTAHDMAKLARAIVYEDPAHYSIYSKKEFKWNNINQPNRNLLLWRDSTVDGLKTGHTEEAGYCMVASAKRDNIRLIAAVFGTNSSNARASETQKILTYGFRFYQTRTFYKKGDVLAKAMVWKGTKDEFKAGLSEDLSLTLPKAQIAKLKASMVVKPQLMAPIKAGDVVGRVNIKLKDKKIYSANLIALESVEEAGFFGRFIDSIRLFFYGLFN